MDCDKEMDEDSYLCFAEGVDGFPSINLYKDGKFVDNYDNSRNFKLVDEFINAYRTPESAAAFQKKEKARLAAKAAKKAKAAGNDDDDD